ncbi:dTDP-4-dehydrorhamnose reductase [Pedobacter sp. W3I1]|uniref:SDR family oxidoreductase n=1 Tax=Pedobacter sp. W3I1 TaxID=3042291 RepID=UPI002785530F|nr:SDR family oxidoreductase [Pedobacter sp. W3I1]MDQ0637088.1 dTDP-4-dehydrorhamnose reductase [Pedobacter sp. W3I1]
MKAFIIGASGLVGSHCLSVFKNNNWDVMGTHLSFSTDSTIAFDFLKDDLEILFNNSNFQPDVIIHCAALTNVDYCEKNVEESYEKTVLPTEKIVDYCKKNNVKLAFISTDYVFDGANGPYREDAEVNPLNVYGSHKLDCEQLVSTLSDYLILRITNVYGEEKRSKNFISRLIEDLRNNVVKELNLPYDQFATPIYAGDIANMTLKLCEDRKNGIYHLSGTDYYNRFQLASKVLSYFKDNKTLKINSVKTLSVNQAALRPLNGGLLNTKFIEEYPEFTFENVDFFILKVTKHEL